MTTMTPPSALVLVDLQNEFLTPEGNFPTADPATVIANISQLVTRFRTQGSSHVVWVRAVYPASPPRERGRALDVLGGRHTGETPCCYEGTPGAELAAAISGLVDPAADVVLTKTWYSAFKETHLATTLRARAVEDVYVAGLLSNVCVLATAAEAQRLGFRTHVVEDCLMYRREESHRRALRSMRELGICVLPTFSPAATTEPPATLDIPTLYYVNGSIPSWRVMMALYEKGVEFEAIRRKVMSTPKETRAPDFLALNHRGKTPVFVDRTSGDGARHPPVVVNESLAILQYIETYCRLEVPLLPPRADRAARALVLARAQETENLHHAYDALEDAHFGKGASGGPLSNEARTRLMDAICAELDYWEVYASRTAFIAGEVFSLADCAFFPLLAYMVHRGFRWERPSFDGVERVGGGDDAWRGLRRYFQRVWERGGSGGCAQRAQPEGWDHPSRRSSVWQLPREGTR